MVLKATSIAGRIAPDILAAMPEMKAVYLNLPAEAYITAILASASGQADLKTFEALRHNRLSMRLGRELPQGQTAGELAAIAWMVERDNQEQKARAAGGRRCRCCWISKDLLGDLEGNLAQLLRHFGEISLPPVADRLVKSPVLGRYSKAPEQLAFSPQVRADLMRRARGMHAKEIEKGLALIGALQPAG